MKQRKPTSHHIVFTGGVLGEGYVVNSFTSEAAATQWLADTGTLGEPTFRVIPIRWVKWNKSRVKEQTKVNGKRIKKHPRLPELRYFELVQPVRHINPQEVQS